jgi:hypothetical protein
MVGIALMQYFRDTVGAVWGYEPGAQDDLIATAQSSGWTDITGSWPPPAPPPPRIISTVEFLNRFQAAAQAAIWTACGASPQLGVGLTLGLAQGYINLDSPVLTAWLQGLVAAGALTAAQAADAVS